MVPPMTERRRGRLPLAPDARRVRLQAFILPETMDDLWRYGFPGESTGQTIERIMRDYKDDHTPNRPPIE